VPPLETEDKLLGYMTWKAIFAPSGRFVLVKTSMCPISSVITMGDPPATFPTTVPCNRGLKIFLLCDNWNCCPATFTVCDAVVVWASLDKSIGRAAIKSFVVEKGTPGMEVARLEHKLGIKASDTATIVFTDCRVPAANLLGNEEIDVKKGFAGVMETFDNTRPVVAAMAVGLARAALERTKEILQEQGVYCDYATPAGQCTAVEAELYKMEADWEAARLLMLKSAWMADNGMPNSKEASMGKAKAGRVCNYITLKCVELCSTVGYAESELLEKWARDSKILDIFEGTQQIQLLIIARRLLGKSSSELK